MIIPQILYPTVSEAWFSSRKGNPFTLGIRLLIEDFSLTLEIAGLTDWTDSRHLLLMWHMARLVICFSWAQSSRTPISYHLSADIGLAQTLVDPDLLSPLTLNTALALHGRKCCCSAAPERPCYCWLTTSKPANSAQKKAFCRPPHIPLWPLQSTATTLRWNLSIDRETRF